MNNFPERLELQLEAVAGEDALEAIRFFDAQQAGADGED